MNESTMSGKWTEIKGEIQQMWGKLTHDDLDRTKGNISAIGGLIEQHYGETKDAVAKKLDEIFQKSGQAVANKSEQAKDFVRDTKTAVDNKASDLNKRH